MFMWMLVLSAVLCLLGPSGVAGAANCPNESLRIGPSALMPDCRAYEMVSPPDTNGRFLEGISGFAFVPAFELFPTELVSPQRDSFIYMTFNGPLLNPKESTGSFDLYEAERSTQGWQTTRRLSPSGAQAMQPVTGGVTPDREYAFTHVSAFLLGGDRPVGSLGDKAGGTYLRGPDGSFEQVGVGSLGTEPYAQGRYISPGGGHVIFSTGKGGFQSSWCALESGKCPVLKLEPDAPPTGTGAIYDREADGETRVVSLLPGDAPLPSGEEVLYQGSSQDGSVVAFKVKGVLYVRVDNAETLEVSAGDPTYAGLSDDGSYVFYVAGGEIHRFDTRTKADKPINSTNDAEPVNISADGSHVYFISESQIGGKGNIGEPNMYVWSDGVTSYVATVASSDLVSTSGPYPVYPSLTNWTDWAVAPMSIDGEKGPGADSSRTTPDGTVLVFESRAKLTDYDNNSHTEIYRYEDGAEGVTCVSCSSLAEPPPGDARLQELQLIRPGIVLHNLSNDGSRVFFETPEALVGADTGGTNDVYEWQEGREGENPRLISSGHSVRYEPLLETPVYGPSPNILFGITPDGDDVFFLSQDALVSGAGLGGAPAIYDARVNGGFPVPVSPEPCLEDLCKSASDNTSPTLSAPRSETTSGTGNVKPRKKRCRRSAKRKKHRRCHKARSRAHSSVLRLGSVQPPPSHMEHPSTESAGGSDLPQATAEEGGGAVTALTGGEFEGWGIEKSGASLSTSAAGAHADFTTTFALAHYINKFTEAPEADARAEEISVSLPPGLLGNPNALPRCKTGEFDAFANCPVSSQVGIAQVVVSGIPGVLTEPLYNLEPTHPESEIARFGFYGNSFPVFIDIEVRTASDYGVTATVHSAPGQGALLEATTTLWGNPADPSHDPQRLTALEALDCLSGTACKTKEGKRSSGLPPTVFMTNPSTCQPMKVDFAVKSYQLPGQVFTSAVPMDAISGCGGLPFAPSFEAQPTSRVAGAPTGLETRLRIPQQSTEAVNSPGTATMREARVSLPEGMQINPEAAGWIGACSDQQIGFHEEVDAACPDASKLGEATIASPSLPVPLHGWLYQRSPSPGHQFGLWLVSDELGLHVKLPGEIEPDPSTGRLTAVFRDLPQVPVEEISLDVWGGPRAPLVNPDACGTYATSYAFAPHSSDPAVSGQSQMTIDLGCGQGFSPTLHAGVTEPIAGKFSPLIVDLTRNAGEQGLRGFELTLPDGELARLKGVPLCPEAQAGSGACPAESRIGHVTTASGPGPEPLWLPQPGKALTALYLAGPYQGSPFSIVTAVPAQAGPFDLGVVAVRSGLTVDRETAQAVVKTDPLPQFFEGVATAYRRIHAVIDRPEFALNPTDCRETKVSAKTFSTQGVVATPASRFQVDGCKALRFKPRFSLALSGGGKRGDYPALKTVLKARKGDANLGRVSVALPHSEFLAQEHIQTICTRKRFAVDECPKGAIYGRVKAWTPLLAKPLQGPVYLRSSNNPLPDLVMDLRGEIDIAVAGRIDSVKGGIRTTFDSVPDAPITKFVLRMKGGSKGLLVNSTDICRGRHRATVAMRGQNGRRLGARLALRLSGCGGKRK